MSWKLFWQIVLLMVIGALVLSTLKLGLLHGKYGRGGKYFKCYPRMEKSLEK